MHARPQEKPSSTLSSDLSSYFGSNFCEVHHRRNNKHANNQILLKRLYHIDVSSINRLQQLACASGNKRTKIEALSAYVWKIMVTAIDGKHQKCKMGWLVDGRSSVHADQNLMPNNIRNMFSVGVTEAIITEQKQRSLY